MLPAERRVRRPADFTTIVRTGRRIGAPGLIVHLGTASNQHAARAGFVVSRAVGPAVVRNRIRRQLRHLIGARLSELPGGVDLVVRVAPTAAVLSRHELAASMTGLLDRAERMVAAA